MAGEPWMAYAVVRVHGRALAPTHKKGESNMALGPIENALADLVRSRGAYADGYLIDAISVFLEHHIVLPKVETDSNEIIDDDDGQISTGSGPEWASADLADNPNWVRNRAMNLLNLADYIENREAIRAAKEAEATIARDQRRDELADEFAPRLQGLGLNWYANVSTATQNAINRVIELEGASK